VATKDLIEALSSPENAYHYAREVIKGRWVEGEHVIAQDAQWSYNYSRDINDRFVKGEPVIAQSPHWAYYYARNVIKGRFILGEPYIHDDTFFSKKYFQLFKTEFTEQEKVLWLLRQ